MEPVSYVLADKVAACYSSELFQQRTMGMEPGEFREYLASQLDEVLIEFRSGKARKGTPAPRRPVVEAERFEEPSAAPSQITHSAACGLLENAPQEVREVYAKFRREGVTPSVAVDRALGKLRELREFEISRQV